MLLVKAVSRATKTSAPPATHSVQTFNIRKLYEKGILWYFSPAASAAAGMYSGSLNDGTKVQLCSAWLGSAVRALAEATLAERGEAQLPPKSICEQFSKVPASHRGKQEQMRGRTDKTCPATLEQN